MPVRTLTAADFAIALQRLLPLGGVWPREPGTVQSQVIAALTPAFSRLAARDDHLLVDAFPTSAVELLPEWEATLGLPDPCAGAAPTLEQRQAQVAARIREQGGQSVPYFQAYAARIGAAIEITEFAPSRFGRPFGRAFGGLAWAYAWRVRASTIPEPGSGPFAGAYAALGRAVLRCELTRIKPAHTVLQFLFVGPGGALPLDEFTLDRDVLV